MKMKREHYAALQALVLQVVGEERQIHGRDIAQNWAHYASKGHTAQRFCWDHLWAIRPTPRQAWFDDNDIYEYLNDDHIYTALNSILGDLR